MTFDDDLPEDPPEDPKDAAILQSAFVAFARYGLRRTSMADIAKGAGMSRPALYLRYAGKEDIFNAMVRIHFQRSERAVAKVLAVPGLPNQTLLAVLQAIDGDAVEAMMTSPHADEILSTNTPFNQTEVQEAHARIVGHIAQWITQGVAAGRLSLAGLDTSADGVAETFMAVKLGIKASAKDFAAYRAAQARVAAIFGRALTR
jgi:AcrR family transcriptional regulator